MVAKGFSHKERSSSKIFEIRGEGIYAKIALTENALIMRGRFKSPLFDMNIKSKEDGWVNFEFLVQQTGGWVNFKLERGNMRVESYLHTDPRRASELVPGVTGIPSGRMPALKEIISMSIVEQYNNVRWRPKEGAIALDALIQISDHIKSSYRLDRELPRKRV